MTEKKIIHVVATSILLVGAFLSIKYYLIQSEVREGDFRYSIVEIKDEYYKGKVIGKTVEYSFMGKVYKNHCASQLCKAASIGDRYFIKVFIKDPNVFEVVNSKANMSEVPYEGWKTLPKAKF